MSKNNVKSNFKTSYIEEDKLILLYLIYQMDIPISWTELLEFAVDDYMDYMSFQLYLGELRDNGILETTTENNSTLYSLTNEGITCVHYFSKRIPESKKNRILSYVRKNRNRIKKEYSVYANYFNYDDDYMVKCGVEEDERPLFEVNLAVFTKEQAKLVRKNWKKHVTEIYNILLAKLLDDSADEENGKNATDKNDDLQTKLENAVKSEVGFDKFEI